uniref:2-isopropylmalate synthase 2 n=1 Tax=Lygus hesperus TaxID=30085 RepID=A0A0A9VW49_LYGHE
MYKRADPFHAVMMTTVDGAGNEINVTAGIPLRFFSTSASFLANTVETINSCDDRRRHSSAYDTNALVENDYNRSFDQIGYTTHRRARDREGQQNVTYPTAHWFNLNDVISSTHRSNINTVELV